jgi:hypothetical protein
MFRSRSAIVRSLALLSILLVAGCGPSGNEKPTAVVRGKITYKSKPVETGTIQFIPDNMGPTAMGAIKKDGTYELSTYREGDGATIGTHKVAIAAKEEQTNFEGNAAMTDGKRLIPDKYFLEVTSGLTADVKFGQENVFDFELTDD